VFTYTVSPALPGITFTGSLVRAPGENAGTYAISQGTLSAGAGYIITFVGVNFTITPAPQTITWTQNLVIGCNGTSNLTLTATTSSGLPVSYTSANTGIVTVNGNTLTIVSQGTVNVTASQAGNNNYLPATNVVKPVIVSQPNLIRKHWSDIIFFDNSSNSYSNYQWFKNGVAVGGATGQYYKENGDLDGSYHATALRNGVLVTSCVLVMTPSTPDYDIKLVPNPVAPGGSYDVETTLPTANLTGARVQIFTSTGTAISDTAASGARTTLSAPSTNGMYIVRLRLANGDIYSANLLVK
jgi:hypothetical protein